jgi:DNA-binding response OmpR family regulator
MSRILIVEDSPTQAAYIRAILEEAGHVVTTAADGSEALARLEQQAFEIVLSDVNMPGMSGYELCAQLRQNPATQQLPIILLTARDDPMAIVRGLECGADNFITKPYDPAYLLERVRTIVEAKRARQGQERVGVDITFLGRNFVITSEKEQILSLLLSTFEEIVRTNAELEARTEELNSVLESIGDGVVVTDAAGKLIMHNHAPPRSSARLRPSAASTRGSRARSSCAPRAVRRSRRRRCLWCTRSTARREKTSRWSCGAARGHTT